MRWARLTRLLRHLWQDETDARRALGPAALDRIEARVREAEQHHRGEIRVCIEAGLPLSYLWRGASARERAVTLFGKLRVWDTEANSGVLIYVLLADHAIEIVADRGLARHVPPAQWHAVVAGMRDAFRAQRYEEGVMAAINAVDVLLTQHFPLRPDDGNPDELDNRPQLL